MISKELFKEHLERGIQGLKTGIPYGYKKLSKIIPNIQQSTYYLIGAESSTGKSAFANDMFVYGPIDWYLANRHQTNIKLKIPYYSFEIPKKDMAFKFVARRIYKKYGILLDVNYLLSRGEYRCSQEHYDLVTNELDDIEEINDIISVRDMPVNPTGILNDMLKLAYENGKGIEYDRQVGFQFKEDYKPNDPNLFVLPVIDHIGLTKKEREFGKKEVIDKLSEYMVLIRNKCFFSPILVQQLNRSLSSTDRFKLGRVEPQLSDFKDSGCTQDDANVILALFSPFRYEIENFRDYRVLELRDRFRSVSVLKNRDGDANAQLGMSFIGEVGVFNELPRGKDMTQKDYDTIKNIKRSFTTIEN
jgi:replicative DNA helicase